MAPPTLPGLVHPQKRRRVCLYGSPPPRLGVGPAGAVVQGSQAGDPFPPHQYPLRGTAWGHCAGSQPPAGGLGPLFILSLLILSAIQLG